ncbi:MAG: hypothetical protein WCI39_02005 [Gallionellaceae bacterium]
MLNATLVLSRHADDGAEMYRKYFVVADFGLKRGEGNASIIPMSAGCPMPEQDRFTVLGGEKEALLSAVDKIKALPGNEGFAAILHFDPSN